MAKMFYSVEEAAEKLGVSVDEVKELASTGKLQQFRDRDKLMFKREAVDALAGNAGSTGIEDAIDMAQKQEAAASKSGSGDAIRISDQTVAGGEDEEDDKKKTGVSVFDADEVSEADPSAPTRMTSMVEESDTDLMIESVGSGSGLLDLTRESDDTSLGAELLDEIYPTTESSTAQDEDARSGSSPGSGGSTGGGTAVFDSAINAEPSTSGLDNLASVGSSMESPNYAAVGTVQELYDPVSSWFASGALFGATAALGLGAVVAYGAVTGIASIPQVSLGNPNAMYMAIGGMLLGSIILMGAGFGYGKLRAG